MNAASPGPRSPYKLFDYYTFEDRDLFFGREEEILRMVGEVLSTRLLVLFAPSGSGKSSLINAGVRPKLEDRGFATVTVRLDGAPDLALKKRLRQTFPEDFGRLSDDIDLVAGLHAAYAPKDGRAKPKPLVIFLDQFEEFFIVFRDRTQLRRGFIQQVARIKFDTALPVYLILSLRDDYFVNLNEFRDEIPSIFHNNANIELRPLSDEAALRAIVEPAKNVGLAFEKGLPEQIVRDLKKLHDSACREEPSPEDRGVLPITLQIVCHKLWEKRPPDGGPLTRELYAGDKAAGGLGGAAAIIRRQLDDSLRMIPRSEYGLMRRLFRVLMTADLTKRLRSVDDLAEILRIRDRAKLGSLLGNLAAASILREEHQERQPWYEFRHDYLVPEVARWLERFEAQLRRRRQRYAWGFGVLPAIVLAALALWNFLSIEVRFTPRQYENQEEELYVTRRFNPFGLHVTTGFRKGEVTDLERRNEVARGYPLRFARPRDWLPMTNLLTGFTAARLTVIEGRPGAFREMVAAIDAFADAMFAATLVRHEPDLSTPLLTCLQSTNASQRRKAADVLSKLDIKSPSLVNGLVGLVKDTDELVRKIAAQALGQLDRADASVVAGLLTLLKDGDPSVRQSAATAVGQLGNSEGSVVDGLLALLKDDSPVVRESAALALTRLGKADAQAVDGLLTLLHDGNPAVQRSTVDALGRLGKTNATVIAGLVALLNDKESSVRRSAAEALGQAGKADATVIGGLSSLLEDGHPLVHLSAMVALGRLGKADALALDRLLALLKDPNPFGRQAAAAALGNLGRADAPVIDGLLALLNEREAQVRRSAAAALGQLGKADTAVIDGLLASLKHAEPGVRESAAMALGQLGNSDAPVIVGLFALLMDIVPKVRRSAAEALNELGKTDAPAIEALAARLKNSNRAVRQYATEALGRLGKAEAPVIDGLLVLLKDSDLGVRQGAAEALGKLGQQRPDWTDARLLEFLQDNVSGWRQTAGLVLAHRESLDPKTNEQIVALRRDKRPWVRLASWDALVQIEMVRDERERAEKEMAAKAGGNPR